MTQSASHHPKYQSSGTWGHGAKRMGAYRTRECPWCGRKYVRERWEDHVLGCDNYFPLKRIMVGIRGKLPDRYVRS